MEISYQSQKNAYKECNITEKFGKLATLCPKNSFAPSKEEIDVSWLSTLRGVKDEGEDKFVCDFSPVHVNVLFLGSVAIGKSSLIRRITKNIFSNDYDMTIGSTFNKLIYMLDEKDVVEFQLFDCSGSERFSGLAQRLISITNMVVICYDCTSQASANSLKTIWEDLRTKKGKSVCLLGIKSDLNQKRQVNLEEMKSYAANEEVPFFGEVSCLTGENVEDFIHFLGEQYQRNKDYFIWIT